MRITTSMMTNTFLGDMNVNLNNMSNRQKQLNTGKEFSRPSDSPYKAARSMQMYSEIYSNEQYNTNISHTVNWLDTTDTAMNSLGNALTRIRELMVSAGNGSYGPEELKSIKDEISEKTNEISQILNTSFDGKYIFGGTKGEKPSSVNDKGEIVPKDQGGTLKVEISQGVVIDYSINADEILSFDNTILKESFREKGTDKVIIKDKDNNTLRIDDKSELIDSSGNKIIYDGNPISVDSEGNINGHDGTILRINNATRELLKEDGTSASTPPILIDNNLDTTGGYTIKVDKQGNQIRIDENSNLINKDGKILTYNGEKIVVDSEGNLKDKDGNKLTLTSEGKIKDKDKVIDIKDEDGNIITNIDVKVDSLVKKKESGNLGELLSGITTALESGDASNVTGEYLSKLDSAISNVLSVRSKVGTLQNRMEGAETINKSQNTNLKEILSHNEDIDWVEKSMEMATVQTIYMASLQSSARILQNSLLDYVR